MRLRYIGPAAVSFAVLGIEVEPGGEFEVDDSLAGAFLHRPDVEVVEDPPPPRKRSTKPQTAPDPVEGGSSLPGSEPAPTATEEV